MINNKLFKLLWFGLLIYYSYLMVLITLQYIPINFNTAFLRLKQNEIYKMHYQVAFFSHVYSSIFVLIIGLLQFIFLQFRNIKVNHKRLGKIYIGIILFFSAPSGLVMAFYANGGITSQVAFSLLSILWFYYTYMAYLSIRKGQLLNHKKFIYRSFALTLSAISLRLFKWIIVNTLELPPMDTYQIVSWLGWVFNLAIAEIYIYKFNN